MGDKALYNEYYIIVLFSPKQLVVHCKYGSHRTTCNSIIIPPLRKTANNWKKLFNEHNIYSCAEIQGFIDIRLKQRHLRAFFSRFITKPKGKILFSLLSCDFRNMIDKTHWILQINVKLIHIHIIAS